MSPDPLAAFRLDGKVALITGAAQGLGAEIATTLAGAGAAVFVTDIQADAIAARSATLRGGGARAAHAVHDVTQESHWESAIAVAVAEPLRLQQPSQRQTLQLLQHPRSFPIRVTPLG